MLNYLPSFLFFRPPPNIDQTFNSNSTHCYLSDSGDFFVAKTKFVCDFFKRSHGQWVFKMHILPRSRPLYGAPRPKRYSRRPKVYRTKLLTLQSSWEPVDFSQTS